MRHKNIHRKFGREAQHRMAMLRNAVSSLIEHERIQTTDMKAKEIRPIVEKVLTLGKKGDVAARRTAFKTVRNRTLIAKIFGPLAERFANRPGGYTRIIKIGQRHGDAAPVSFIELLPAEGGAAAPKTEAAPKAEKAKKVKAEKPAGEAKAKKTAKTDGEAPKAAKKKAK